MEQSYLYPRDQKVSPLVCVLSRRPLPLLKTSLLEHSLLLEADTEAPPLTSQAKVPGKGFMSAALPQEASNSYLLPKHPMLSQIYLQIAGVNTTLFSLLLSTLSQVLGHPSLSKLDTLTRSIAFLITHCALNFPGLTPLSFPSVPSQPTQKSFCSKIPNRIPRATWVISQFPPGILPSRLTSQQNSRWARF